MIRIIKFGVVGCLATLVHLGVLAFSVQVLSIPPMAGNVVAFCVAFIVSYLGQTLWTFADRNHDHAGSGSVGRFLSVQVFSNFVLNQGLFFLLIEYTALHYLVASVIVLITVAFVTYLLSYFWALR
jgi:putative flippase GtrA